MKLASIVAGDGHRIAVVVDDGSLVDVASLRPGLPNELAALLALGATVLEDLSVAASNVPRGAPRWSLEEVEFRPVVRRPAAVWCAAINYRLHGVESGAVEAEYPGLFVRVVDSLTGHRRPIFKPTVSDRLDYEGELAVVIGLGGRSIAREDARRHIAGYTCANDATVRDWQRHTTQIAPGKNFSQTGAVGPWLVTVDEFGPPERHRITTRVNGDVRQDESIDALLFDVPYLVNYISTIHRLHPGDLILTGTPAGVGNRMEPPQYLQHGDVVTVEVDGIGTLENAVVDDVVEGSDAATEQAAGRRSAMARGSD